MQNAELTDAMIAGANFTQSGFTREQLYTTASYRDRQLQGIAGAHERSYRVGFQRTGPLKSRRKPGGADGRDLAGALVTGSRFSDTTKRGLTPAQLYSTASYQQKKLTEMDLSRNDLSGWSLAGQNLSATTMWHSKLVGTDLSNADLTGADFRETDLTQAILTSTSGGSQSQRSHGADGRAVLFDNKLPAARPPEYHA